MDWMAWFVDLLAQESDYSDHADRGDGTRDGFVKVIRSADWCPGVDRTPPPEVTAWRTER